MITKKVRAEIESATGDVIGKYADLFEARRAATLELHKTASTLREEADRANSALIQDIRAGHDFGGEKAFEELSQKVNGKEAEASLYEEAAYASGASIMKAYTAAAYIAMAACPSLKGLNSASKNANDALSLIDDILAEAFKLPLSLTLYEGCISVRVTRWKREKYADYTALPCQFEWYIVIAPYLSYDKPRYIEFESYSTNRAMQCLEPCNPSPARVVASLRNLLAVAREQKEILTAAKMKARCTVADCPNTGGLLLDYFTSASELIMGSQNINWVSIRKGA